MATTKKEVRPLIKGDVIRISKDFKKMVVDNSQKLKQTEKQFVENAILNHCSKIEREQPLVDKMREVGLI
jgi:hypothetical protein